MCPDSDLSGGSSKRHTLRAVYDVINRVASPGDVVFFVSHGAASTACTAFPILGRMYRRWRRWQGFVDEDTTVWHTAIYVGAKKESHGSLERPYVVHSPTRGVEEIHLLPSFFSSVRSDAGDVIQQGRIEIIQHPHLTPAQRAAIVAYVRRQIGKPFEDLGWRYLLWTYAFGLPTRCLTPDRVSCHGLAFQGYHHAGLSFPHQLDPAPFFNLGRYRRRPLFGHPPDRVNLDKLYLIDHHLYRDPRFQCVASVFEDAHSRQFRVIEHPGKYSWNPVLQKRYNPNP
jgi:hypothetical protein